MTTKTISQNRIGQHTIPNLKYKKPVYHNTISIKDKYCVKLYYFNGLTIRNKDRYGEKLVYVDGQTVRTKDKYDDKLSYFDGYSENGY